MIRYDLARLADRRKGTTQPLPAIHGSLGAESSYRKALRAMLREMAAHVRQHIVPVAEREIAASRALTRDMGEREFENLESLTEKLVAIAGATVRRILGLEARRHTETFMATAKRVLGVDLAAVVRQEDLADYLDTASARNVGLIKGLGADTVKRIQTAVTNAVVNGVPAKDLRKQLTKEFGLSDRRAKVIARDQIAKLNSDLNRQRHLQAGVTTYTWRTSHDERVRPLHRELDGEVYEYGKPTGAEDGLPPGQPIMCRCVAIGIVQF
ncbi:MAG: minor capsid protein [Rhizobiales bacterium]|nr:minor capsid protein [Hyphomicrobiales bacterium]